MTRDLALTFSVFISIISIIFGVYKNVEAGNARTFAYAQMYRVLGLVQDARLATPARNTLVSDMLASLTSPAPVIDFSQSNASEPATCSRQQRRQCIDAMQRYAELNQQCAKVDSDVQSCQDARSLRDTVMSGACSTCFNY